MAKLVLNHDYQVQKYGWNCGPTAARTSLSTKNVFLSQDQIIREINAKLPKSSWVDDDGTDYVALLEPVLDTHSDGSYSVYYPKSNELARFWTDIRGSVAGGRGVVANIVAPANDHPPGYPNYKIWHYVAVVGFDDDGQQFYVADSANFSGINHYWISAKQLLRLVSGEGKGYAYGAAAVGFLDSLSDAQQQELYAKVVDIFRQLAGANFAGWPQGGGRTLYDLTAAVAASNGVKGARDTKGA